MIVEKNELGSKKTSRLKSPFRQISKGVLVTIHDDAGERKGHASSKDHGNWLLILERNGGTAHATKENTVAVSKPKRLEQHPNVGQRLVYDDGRRSTGKVLGVGPRSMQVLFDDRTEPNLIYFDDPQWMDYISFEE